MSNWDNRECGSFEYDPYEEYGEYAEEKMLDDMDRARDMNNG